MAATSGTSTSFLGRFWFPLSLLLVLLLTIPGLVLFALYLSGRESGVNRWLEDSFQLSYSPPIPWWAGLLLLLIPLAILLLYFLKLKRKPLGVPSTFLWKKSIEDLRVNSLFQWLRENVLLLLQLLIVVALIYGVLAFRFHGRTGEGKHYILMIDNSASMMATDVEPSRLEWAKEEALKEIDACTDYDVGMVIVFNSSAETRQSYTTNRHLLRQVVKGIEPTQRTTRLDEALSLADSLANLIRSTDDTSVQPADADPSKKRSYVAAEGIPTEVHLYSDGRFPPVPEFSLGNISMHYHAAGKLVEEFSNSQSAPVVKPAPESSDNVAVVSLTATRDEQDPTKIEVRAGVINYRDKDVTTEMQLEYFVNGRLKDIQKQELKLPARHVIASATPEEEIDKSEEMSTTFFLSEVDDRANVVVHVKLLNVGDKFPLDDEGWLVIGMVRKAQVLLVGEGNHFLDLFFDEDEVKKVAAVTRLRPADLATDAYRKPAREGSFDLVIFDRCGPEKSEEMPRANTFFMGFSPRAKWSVQDETETPLWTASDRVEYPHITGWMRDHPVLKDLTTLYEVGVAEAFKIKKLPDRTPRLIETERDMAILIALTRGSFTDLVMTFPLINEKNERVTNWPLHPSFPLFMRNVLNALGNLSDAATEETVQPGQVKKLRPDASVKQLEVVNPAGSGKALAHDDRDQRTDFAYGDTDRVGVYQVRWDGKLQRQFAVNLLDASESNIEPRPVIKIGVERIVTGQERRQPHDLWKWFALLALVLVLLEWYIYNKRIYV